MHKVARISSSLLLIGAVWAQYGVVPDTIVKEWRRGSYSSTGILVFRARGNPMIREEYYPDNSGNWELSRRDTLVLDNQGRLDRFSVWSFRNTGSGGTDSSLYRVRANYPSADKGIFLAEEWDPNDQNWKNGVKVELKGQIPPFSLSWENISASIFAEFFGFPEELPKLYKRAHFGDTLLWYWWDDSTNNWNLRYGYARRARSCDSLILIPPRPAEIEVCFDGNDYLTRWRDTSADDSSVSYLYVFYANGRVVTDSSEYIDYDGSGQIAYNSRQVCRYAYTSSGGFDSIQCISVYSQGGIILRRRLRSVYEQRPHALGALPLSQARTASVDTSVSVYRFIYRSTSLGKGVFQGNCFSYSSTLREGRVGCLGQAEKLALELYDVMGRRVWQGEVSGAVPTFQLPASLPAGVYVLRAGEAAQKLYLEP